MKNLDQTIFNFLDKNPKLSLNDAYKAFVLKNECTRSIFINRFNKWSKGQKSTKVEKVVEKTVTPKKELKTVKETPKVIKKEVDIVKEIESIIEEQLEESKTSTIETSSGDRFVEVKTGIGPRTKVRVGNLLTAYQEQVKHSIDRLTQEWGDTMNQSQKSYLVRLKWNHDNAKQLLGKRNY